MRYTTILLASALALLTSCSYIYGDKGLIQNRSTDYLRAKSIPPLQIPPGISSSTIESHYPVSEIDYPESQKNISLIPPELNQSIHYPSPHPLSPDAAQPTTIPGALSDKTRIKPGTLENPTKIASKTPDNDPLDLDHFIENIGKKMGNLFNRKV